MIDREKVIKGLEYCVNAYPMCGDKCPYMHKCMEFPRQIKKDALELLKEQKTKTGHWVSVDDGDVVAIDNDGFPERACFCSECKKYLIASDEYAVYGRYCPFCGTKMEGR